MSELDYPVNWSRFLAASGDGDVLLSVDWVVPTDLTLTDQENNDTVATAWIAGGTAGQIYEVVCRAQTRSGRSHDFPFRISVLAE